MKDDMSCVEGHIPVIIHRTGGPSAEERNVCGNCGEVIYKLDKTWFNEEEFQAELNRRESEL